ncbi:hypothetical protein [Streptomyces atratus]|uniref:hypothetical protein n=1 Tax=Streptomyces atratus TaxID=1893 RepID=UPI00130084D6|nr:hypothetical protein [Streptomyces atratus]
MFSVRSTAASYADAARAPRRVGGDHDTAHRGVTAQGRQHDIVVERRPRVRDLGPVPVGQLGRADDGLALLGPGPPMAGRQQPGRPVLGATAPTRPADDDDVGSASHPTSITRTP